nr:MAG TPA: Ragulator complex protein LAMTOR4, Ragulator signal transduction pathway, SIGNALING.03A [Bacteriophage sp.]
MGAPPDSKSPASRFPGQWGYIAISDLTFSD